MIIIRDQLHGVLTVLLWWKMKPLMFITLHLHADSYNASNFYSLSINLWRIENLQFHT
jgi:hypothetical protein